MPPLKQDEEAERRRRERRGRQGRAGVEAGQQEAKLRKSVL